METELGITPEPLFRPVKRRKFLRRRPDHEREDSQEGAQRTKDENEPADTAQETDDTVRVRRPQRTRKGGIEFSASSRQTTDNTAQTLATVATAEETEDEKVRAMCDRFTAHTGQSVNVDKHMMDYIETEMAKRHRREPMNKPVSESPNRNEVSEGASTSGSNFAARREPATLGKLHEIDLGQESKLRNIARTEAATRRLIGDDTAQPVDEDGTEKPAPGKDGKPWRNRKRRNSKDIERDRLVEEVLRESKLDIYDEPDDDEPQADDLAADDRIAEQFRRDFMDAIQSRRRAARNTTRNPKPTKTEAPRGPKLGGSRSARAAMRESQKTQK